MQHEFLERVEDEGDLWYYTNYCKVCNYAPFGQEVPYEINSFYSAGEISSRLETSGSLKPKYDFRAGVGYAKFASASGGGNVSISVLKGAEPTFPSGKYLVMKVKIGASQKNFSASIASGAVAGKEKEVIFPTSLATVVSEPGAETEEYGWTTYVIDLPKAVPSVFIPDENGEYKIHNLYFQMGTDKGLDYTADVYYDVDFMAFVDTWSEVKTLVPDDTVIKVNATNDGTLVKTQEQECVGEHSWGENIDGREYTYLCVNCGKNVKTVTVPSFVNAYFSGYEIARNAAVYAIEGTRSVIFENGTVFGRVNGCAEIWWMRSQKDYSHGVTDGSLDNKTIDVGEAKYMVVRLKTDNTAKNFEFYISTTGKSGTPRTEAEVTDKKPITVPTTSGYTTITSPVQASVAGEWTTYVFDLEALIPDHYVKDEATGHYILDTFGVPFSRDVDMDVEFIAFVEGGWKEIDALTPDETVVFATHHKNKTYSIMDAATGKCANDQHSYLYEGEEQSDGSVIYTYACGGCGDKLYEKKVGSAVTKFFSGNDVAFGASTYALSGTKAVGVGDDGVFYGRVSNHAEIWWMRHQQDFKGDTGGNLNNKFIDVGEAKYFVFRFRTSDPSKGFEFYLSTTGKNGDGYSVSADGTVTRPTANGYTSFSTPVSQTATAGEWITYVFDLEEIFSNYYVKDPETGHYILDTFAITYPQGYDADVEFMAFVDGDLSDVFELTPDDTVVQVTHSKNKTYEIIELPLK